MANETSDRLKVFRDDLRRYVQEAGRLLEGEELTAAVCSSLIGLAENIKARAQDVYNSPAVQSPDFSEFGPPDLEFGELLDWSPEQRGDVRGKLAWERGFHPMQRCARGLLQLLDGRQFRFLRKSTIPLEHAAARVHRYYIREDGGQVPHPTLVAVLCVLERQPWPQATPADSP